MTRKSGLEESPVSTLSIERAKVFKEVTINDPTLGRFSEPVIRVADESKMVLLGRPRQVGTTILAFALIGRGADEGYQADLLGTIPALDAS